MMRVLLVGAVMAIAGCETGLAATPLPSSAIVAPSAGAAVETSGPMRGTVLQFAIVSTDRVELRAEPGEDEAAQTYAVADAGVVAVVPVTVSRGDLIAVFDTRDSDDGRWAQVAVNIRHHFFETVRVGWMPIGSSHDPSIVPFDTSGCPEVSDGHLVDVPFPHALVSLACFAGEAISIEGRLDAPITRECLSGDGLECGWSNVPSVLGLPLFVLPGSGIVLPADGSEITAIGHFDDLTSATCAGDEAQVNARLAATMRCRTSFVVDAVVSPPSAPGTLADLQPLVRYVGQETYADGAWTRELLRVDNIDDFPSAMFAAAPELPPCGALERAARTWVRISDDAGRELAIVCKPGSPHDFVGLSFVHPSDVPPPKGVYVDLIDRLAGLTYRSDVVDLSR